MELELSILLALLRQYIEEIKDTRLLELEARDTLSGDLGLQLSTLFPNAPADFLDSNAHFSNELARGAGEIADVISAAAINWTGAVKDSGVEKLFTKELVRLLAVEALVTGKIAIFPRINEAGVFTAEVLTGFLHPILNEGNALEVLEVLQVTHNTATKRYTVRRFSPGMVREYKEVQDWTKFDSVAPIEWPQPHSKDRLPLAFAVVRRNAHMLPYGLVSECMSAFRRYAKNAVNRNAVQEIAGFPERVIKSDRYLQLLTGDRRRPGVGEGMEDPAITAIKQTGPRKVKFLGSSDVYEITQAADPSGHIAAEDSDKQALLDLLRAPDLGGSNLAVEAIEEKQSKHRQLVRDMCEAIATLVTDACRLGNGLEPGNFPIDLLASLSPRFPAEMKARATEVREFYKVGLFTKSMALQELQTAGYSSITDEMIEAARLLESGDALPIVGG